MKVETLILPEVLITATPSQPPLVERLIWLNTSLIPPSVVRSIFTYTTKGYFLASAPRGSHAGTGALSWLVEETLVRAEWRIRPTKGTRPRAYRKPTSYLEGSRPTQHEYIPY